MGSQFSVSMVSPGYKEVKRIAQTHGEARRYFDRRGESCEIIVAADGDDGACESVAEMAQYDPGLFVLGSVEWRGKGYGIRAAVAIACGEGVRFVDDKPPIDEYDVAFSLIGCILRLQRVRDGPIISNRNLSP